MKPLGIEMKLHGSVLGIGVHHPSRAEDTIWNAVETAIIENWTPKQFKREAAEAWQNILKHQAENACKELIR